MGQGFRVRPGGGAVGGAWIRYRVEKGAGHGAGTGRGSGLRAGLREQHDLSPANASERGIMNVTCIIIKNINFIFICCVALGCGKET